MSITPELLFIRAERSNLVFSSMSISESFIGSFIKGIIFNTIA
ncbi:MAG: hypothetical protein BWY64_03083 [bacterium ADurb.Bin363]|nr:MAG: hypothetical protein BWY64_03083 [bacterium ADurb.Bin363]